MRDSQHCSGQLGMSDLRGYVVVAAVCQHALQNRVHLLVRDSYLCRIRVADTKTCKYRDMYVDKNMHPAYVLIHT